jgi:hypothetical protein
MADPLPREDFVIQTPESVATAEAGMHTLASPGAGIGLSGADTYGLSGEAKPQWRIVVGRFSHQRLGMIGLSVLRLTATRVRTWFLATYAGRVASQRSSRAFARPSQLLRTLSYRSYCYEPVTSVSCLSPVILSAPDRSTSELSAARCRPSPLAIPDLSTGTRRPA